MLQGASPSPEEQHTSHWLKTPLFSNGLETEIPQLGMHMHKRIEFPFIIKCLVSIWNSAYYGRFSCVYRFIFMSKLNVCICVSDACISSLLEVALCGNEEQRPFDCQFHADMSVLVDLALGSTKEPTHSLWTNMQDYAISKGMTQTQNIHWGLWQDYYKWFTDDWSHLRKCLHSLRSHTLIYANLVTASISVVLIGPKQRNLIIHISCFVASDLDFVSVVFSFI